VHRKGGSIRLIYHLSGWHLGGFGKMALMTHKIRRTKAEGRLCSSEQLHAILERERVLADRNGHRFSFVVFEVGDTPVADVTIQNLARMLISRLRFTDKVGWLGRRQIGVVLPDTSAEGAYKLINEMCLILAGIDSSPVCKVYIYPSQGFCDTKANAQTFGGTAKSPVRNNSKTGDPYLFITSLTASVAQENAACRRICEEPAGELDCFLFPRLPFWKRAIDIIGSMLGIILTAPIMIMIALAIKLTSAGPVIFMQKRIGYRSKPFMIYKFRSMYTGVSDALHEQYTKEFMNGTAEKNDDGAFKLKDDPRLTYFGKFLRRWSLDELPQLFNVLNGKMSLVGPRPDPWYAAAHYAPWYHLRTMMTKPGITGLWQVEGRSQVTCEEMIRMDIQYGQSISFMTDLKLMLRTFKTVFTHTGAY
jgi:lipopolysaccharide/colanic/teichoic acid biosynthesis glycosyltransferase